MEKIEYYLEYNKKAVDKIKLEVMWLSIRKKRTSIDL